MMFDVGMSNRLLIVGTAVIAVAIVLLALNRKRRNRQR
jgi:hypothetical protein